MNMNVSAVMKEYFEEKKVVSRKILSEAPGRSVPIGVKKQTWSKTTDPETLQRTFSFSSPEKMIYFLEDVIQMQNAMGHHGIITINENKVSVRIFTKTLERVTDLDVEWANNVGKIFDDVNSEINL